MEEIISGKELEELMKAEGEARGVIFKADAQFVIKEKGVEGLKKVEEEMRKLGYPITYNEIETMGFYPIGLKTLSLLVIKETFGFSDEKIKEMGMYVPKFSWFLRMFVGKFFVREDVFFNQVPKVWKKSSTRGELIPIKFNGKKHELSFQIKRAKIHSVYCPYLIGAFIGIMKMLTKSEYVVCEETKCPFGGDEHYEFSIKW